MSFPHTVHTNQAPRPRFAPGEDLIEDFILLTVDESSPEIFRRWTAIAMVAAALERRVWITTGPKTTFANLYTFLVGPPGVGKGIINRAKGIMARIELAGSNSMAFRLASDSVTPASLINEIAEAAQERTGLCYSALFAMPEELSVLMPQYDMGFVGLLNGLYNNVEFHREHRRHGKPPKIEIEFPVLNILAGTQPAFIASCFPEETWSTGLGRRCMMIYDDSPLVYGDPFFITPGAEEFEPMVADALSELAQWHGGITWSMEAMIAFREWAVEKQGAPMPTHSKLGGYKRNRLMNLMKLSGISVASRRDASRTITLDDFIRAKGWMLEAEYLMPDIFRAMAGKSDWQVLEELHIFTVARWQATGQKSVSGTLMRQFLAGHVPGNKALEIMTQGESAGFFRRDKSKPDEWFFPSPKLSRVPE